MGVVVVVVVVVVVCRSVAEGMVEGVESREWVMMQSGLLPRLLAKGNMVVGIY